MESEMGMDNELVTKQDLAAAVGEIKEHVDERTRAVETNLRTAFSGWARTIEIKVRSIHALDERLTVLEERLSEVERKQNPPQ
jgi:hypothetical protein